jgi:proteasome lid subunit RPN8/RPN11
MIYIGTESKERMNKEAEATYPDECCGFMYGTEDSEGNRTITDVFAVTNGKEGDKRKRFEITPKDYLHGEQYALDHDLTLLGVFHSHPDHPPIPSEHDRVAAQPYFSYLIISVKKGTADEAKSWRLNDKEQFDEEQVTEHPIA